MSTDIPVPGDCWNSLSVKTIDDAQRLWKKRVIIDEVCNISDLDIDKFKTNFKDLMVKNKGKLFVLSTPLHSSAQSLFSDSQFYQYYAKNSQDLMSPAFHALNDLRDERLVKQPEKEEIYFEV